MQQLAMMLRGPDIPPDRVAGQLLRLKEFKLEAAVPYVYDRFIGV